MIISTLKKLTIKSFDNYDIPDDFFKRKNLVFGHNGRGKSSLARAIIDEYRSFPETSSDGYRFFNRDYVRDKLLLTDSNNELKGVKAFFGEKDTDIQNKIIKLESEIVDTIQLKMSIKEDSDTVRQKINDIHDSKKGKARISKKNSSFTLRQLISSYENDLEDAKKVNPNLTNIKDFSGDSESLEKELERVQNIVLPNLEIKALSSEDLEFLDTCLSKNYKLEDIPSFKIVNWIEEGLSIHHQDEHECLFCHSQLNIEEIKLRVEKYKRNQVQKDTQRLSLILEKLKNNLSLFNEAKNSTNSLRILEVSEEEIHNYYTIESEQGLIEIINIIITKLSDMNNTHSVNLDSIKKFENQVNKLDLNLKNLRSSKLNRINSDLSNIETLTKGAIYLAIKDTDILQSINSIENSEKELISIERSNNIKRLEIENLNKSLSEYSDFAEFLNEVLKDLGIQFSLQLHGKNYYLQHNFHDVVLSINDISEGEKNLLALLFFYFELYSDKEQLQIKETIELIVVDDPISSLDESNRFYVLEIIKRIFEEDQPQVFIFTHSWNDFSRLGYRLNDENVYSLFEVYKKETSEVRKIHENLPPYKLLFKEIIEVSRKNYSEELTEAERYHTANSMRRVFEEFLYFKKPNLLPQRSNHSAIEEFYMKATGEPLSNNYRRKLGELLSFINVLSHTPYRSDAVIANAKFLMNLIQKLDKVHYDSMIS